MHPRNYTHTHTHNHAHTHKHTHFAAKKIPSLMCFYVSAPQMVRCAMQELCAMEKMDSSKYYLTVTEGPSASDEALNQLLPSSSSSSTPVRAPPEPTRPPAGEEHSTSSQGIIACQLWHVGVFKGATEVGGGNPGLTCREIRYDARTGAFREDVPFGRFTR